MKENEYLHILAAVIILSLVFGFSSILIQDWVMLSKMFLYAIIIIFIAVISKKFMAYLLDCGVEHRIWTFQRFGWKAQQKLFTPVPTGIILPAIFSLFSLGLIKLGTLLVYESRALKHRAAKRFGYYSFTELTEWHNGLIGAAGTLSLLLLSLVSYLINQEPLAILSTYYAVTNLIPFSNLDGTQIFFGSRVLYFTILIIALVFFAYALMLSPIVF